MTIFQFIGVVGFISYISCFTCVQLSLVKAPSVRFSLWNLTSASLVLISLSENFNLGAALIQVSWITISLVTLYWQVVRPRWKIAKDKYASGKRGNVGTVLAGGLLLFLGVPSAIGNDYDARAQFVAMKTTPVTEAPANLRVVYAAMID